jgi:hypothetical protein
VDAFIAVTAIKLLKVTSISKKLAAMAAIKQLISAK